jgi:hypothetical protein
VVNAIVSGNVTWRKKLSVQLFFKTSTIPPLWGLLQVYFAIVPVTLLLLMVDVFSGFLQKQDDKASILFQNSFKLH